jgi:sugar phosphate isomerase/epimerase
MLLSFNSRALGLDLGPIQSIQLASKSGFDAVDLLVRDLVDHGPSLHLIADALRERNLRPGAWPLPVQWRGCREVYRLDLARLPVHAQAAQNLGLHATATWVFPAWPDPPPDGLPSHKDALGWQVDRLTPIARILTDHGIALGLEIIGIPAARQGAAFPLIHRHADLPVLLDLFDPSLLVGYLFDSFHLAATGEDPATLLELPERYPIVWVHLAELPGELRIDLLDASDRDRLLPASRTPELTGTVLRNLARRGFVGPVTIETLAVPAPQREMSPANYARLAVELIRPLWP